MNKVALFLFFFIVISGVSSTASASEVFDGKWYFEDELLMQFLPPGYEDAKNDKEIEALAEQFFNNTYMVIDTVNQKIEVAVSGEGTETDYFEIVEKLPNILRIKPLDDSEITVLTILNDGGLEMKVESSGYAMYLRRERQK